MNEHKVIRAHLDGDGSRLILDENAQIGDYVDLTKFTASGLHEFQANVEAEVQRRSAEICAQAVSQFKESKEFQDLLADRQSLQNFEANKKQEQESALLKLQGELSKEYDKKINALKEELAQKKVLIDEQEEKAALNQENALLEQEKRLKAIHQGDLDAWKKENNDLRNQLNNAKSTQDTAVAEAKLEITQAKNDEQKKLQDKIDQLTTENDRLKREHNQSIKRLGNNLENWCQEQYERCFGGGMLLGATFQVASINDSKDVNRRKKPDFLFRVQVGDLSESAIFEMKSEETDSTNKRSNESHLKKLEKDRKSFGSQYGILVSELSSGYSSQYLWTIDSEYPDIFIVQPVAFIPVTRMVYALLRKRLELEEAKKEYTIAESESILREFEAMKQNILENSVKNLQNNVSKVHDGIEKIQQIATNLLENELQVINTHIDTIIKKINGFGIKRIVRRVSALEKK